MTFFSSLGGTWTPDDNSSPLPSGAGEGGREGGADIVGGGGIPRGDCRDNVADSSIDNGRSSGIGGASIDVSSSGANGNNSNIVEISSRDDLLRILGTRRKGQGPVVVMYHAPWCRKCAYLTPMFRRFAAARMAGAAETQATASGDAVYGGSSMASTEPIFCRADVSHPSWGRRHVVNGAAAAAASEGTATLPAAAPADAAIAEEEVETELLHAGSPGLENCDVCGRSGFVPCGECEGKGAVARSSPDGKHTMAVTCPACVGYKRLRCPSCGGKCYMCD